MPLVSTLQQTNPRSAASPIAHPGVPDTPAGLYAPAFPSAASVRAAAATFTRSPAWDGREGPRARILLGPGVVQIARTDPARADRAHERAVRSALAATDQLAVELLEDGEHQAPNAGPARIISWSRKSRANMVKVLNFLDYSTLLTPGGGTPAMVTLTYPGEWETVAPSAAAAMKHLRALRWRFERHYGTPLIGVWKREFQRRGAPHFHLYMVPPDPLKGEHFRTWLSRTWASVVAHPDLEQRAAHALAGTGVDYAEGIRSTDPKRLGIYFAKHGAFTAKEYQNRAPDLWVSNGSVGRFWGVWGIPRAVAAVEVTPAEATTAERTMRRYHRANGYSVQRPVWRYEASRIGVDDLGAATGRPWRRRKVNRRVKRMRGNGGFLTLNDGPAFAQQLARFLDLDHTHRTGELRP